MIVSPFGEIVAMRLATLLGIPYTVMGDGLEITSDYPCVDSLETDFAIVGSIALFEESGSEAE